MLKGPIDFLPCFVQTEARNYRWITSKPIPKDLYILGWKILGHQWDVYSRPIEFYWRAILVYTKLYVRSVALRLALKAWGMFYHIIFVTSGSYHIYMEYWNRESSLNEIHCKTIIGIRYLCLIEYTHCPSVFVSLWLESEQRWMLIIWFIYLYPWVL